MVSIGRLDLNSEGLLLLTNDGALKRRLELPSTGWLRKYRVRARGAPEDASLEPLRRGITVDGERFQPMRVDIDRQQGANVWLTVALREGRNREVRRALEAVGLAVNRLIRVSYGPFQLGELEPGEVEEVRPKVLREQLGGGKAPAPPRRRRKSAGGGRPRGQGPAKSGAARARTARPEHDSAALRNLERAGALAPVAAVDQLVLDRLVVLQRLQAGGLHRGDMDEDVLAAVRGLDEPVALLGVEPLDGALGHAGKPFGQFTRAPRPGSATSRPRARAV